jgi:hypothetical protein
VRPETVYDAGSAEANRLNVTASNTVPDRVLACQTDQPAGVATEATAVALPMMVSRSSVFASVTPCAAVGTVAVIEVPAAARPPPVGVPSRAIATGQVWV